MTPERMPTHPHSDYIDQRALALLRDDLSGDENCVRLFVQDFICLWSSRAERLADAIASAILDAAHVVLLSIHSTARMLGAALLAASAAVMLAAVKNADLAACGEQMSGLLELGQQTCRAFGTLLEDYPSAALRR